MTTIKGFYFSLGWLLESWIYFWKKFHLMESSSPRIRSFEQLPLPIEFESLIESSNAPAVFKGCVNDWKAFSKWKPSNGGLDYLLERVGSCVVEAMLSKSAPVFYGDLRSHERVHLPFSNFIGFCKKRLQNAEDGASGNFEVESHGIAESESVDGCLTYDGVAQQIYLAQVPIMHVDNEDKVQLETLREDIHTEKVLASVNLWMNSAQARSSTHYDPHHNLLCLVSGCKRVLLWPPSASPMLYPMPIYGEASNHSLLAVENPDLLVYPRAKCLMENSQKIILHAGDALFIPEGWFHQVDSDDLTIAVNFWWRSNIMSGMSEHMDAYYLRRILKRLADKEMNEVLCKSSSAEIQNMKRHTCALPSTGEADSSTGELDLACGRKGLKGKDLDQRAKLNDLEQHAVQALHELVSLVHDRISTADCGELVHSESKSNSGVSAAVEGKKAMKTNSFSFEDDPVSKILWNLEPSTLESVFLAMAFNFPRTLEALILHLLSPVAAEVLTRKFDELDQLKTEEDRNKFYQVFYGAFDDQFAAMDAILNGKESFALQLQTPHKKNQEHGLVHPRNPWHQRLELSAVVGHSACLSELGYTA
ncbi:lysine-specific demethylase JMJ31 isoform X2 [Humulus lupulus]|uniref:lysine-specific demethylase JMJ31 isoform X2 n=1 Tax=Humulus lupulus TaxID=3486 RepID=UPI002B407A3B|nr:lysine-specific demethylase JMJ31 isoform X2 [Humulus lupulus]